MKRFPIQPWQLAAAVIVLCAAAVALAHYRSAGTLDAAGLIDALPPDQSTRVYLDFDALRRGGILNLIAGSKAAEEPDYRKFVEQTGFDYRTDLDAAAAGFFHGGTYMTLRGRFVWNKLAAYARAQGGSCGDTVCTMPASTPDRHISFYLLKPTVLAMAVSTEERGVSLIGLNQAKNPPQLPAEPVWISAPSFVFADVNNLPAGTHSFLSPLAQAQQVTFAIGPKGDQLQLRLDVLCTTPETAAALATQLSQTTSLLKKMLERDHMTPNPTDLSGVLVAGTFQNQNNRVAGTWPIQRSFIESLASGKIQ